NHLGWKRPLRSWSPTVNLTLPAPLLNHVPKRHIYILLNTCRDGDSIHGDFQDVAIVQGKARAHKRNDACVSSVWVLLSPCGVLPSQDEIQEVKNEGNLELLFNSLDKMVEEAKNQEEPAWRPSGIPEEDIRSAMVPYLLKHRSYLRKILKEKEEENRKVAESVLAGRNRIGELQQLIQARKHAWQAISKEQRELIMTFKEPQ
uniref:Polyamine modulated factor 1 n=1 Tax=Aquila chrysaetos chrysaetos TaxID=223781 RepID=A0A663DUL1_AQUCH